MLYAFPKLRIILMSATIDTKMFLQYFKNCPVLEIEGFMHPVKGIFILFYFFILTAFLCFYFTCLYLCGSVFLHVIHKVYFF